MVFQGVQMMYIGSLMVALAVEESGLHRRIALRALSLAVRKFTQIYTNNGSNREGKEMDMNKCTMLEMGGNGCGEQFTEMLLKPIFNTCITYTSTQGTRPAYLMLGFMLPTAFLSMWISNAATSAMMVRVIEPLNNYSLAIMNNISWRTQRCPLSKLSFLN